MANPPAYCSNCGAIFPSPISILGGGRVTLVGNITNCPRCGGAANILDGVFGVTNGVLQLLSGPQITRDVLRAVTTLIERAVRKEITPQDLEKEVTAINPELGAAVSEITKSPWPLAVLTILMLALQQCNLNVDVNVDINSLWDQIINKGVLSETYMPADSKNDARDSQRHKEPTDGQPTRNSPKIEHLDRRHEASPNLKARTQLSRHARRREAALQRKRPRKNIKPKPKI